jgi:hypothetical protein
MWFQTPVKLDLAARSAATHVFAIRFAARHCEERSDEAIQRARSAPTRNAGRHFECASFSAPAGAQTGLPRRRFAPPRNDESSQ